MGRYDGRWYDDSGEWGQHLDHELRKRPNSGAVTENLDPDFDMEDLNGWDDYDARTD